MLYPTTQAGDNDFPVTGMLFSAGIQKRGQDGGREMPMPATSYLSFDYLVQMDLGAGRGSGGGRQKCRL